MKKLMLPLLLTGLILGSCQNKNEKTAETTTSETTTEVVPQDSAEVMEVSDGHTTENSVDWNGTYKGTIPCASCPGIESTLTLNTDKTYVLESSYIGEKKQNFVDKGTFEFSKDGSFITLKDDPAPNESKVFFVGENQVFMAEKVGDRSMKEDYKLTKKL